MNVSPTACWISFSSTCIAWRSFRSSAPSGSSSSSTRGRITSARASATRWRCPPESWAGLRAPNPVEPHHLERLVGASGALGLRRLAHHEPVARRSRRPSCAGRARSPGRRCSRRVRTAACSPTSTPPSSTRPSVGRSNPAIMRRHVVLPDPDGPSIEKNSPSRTSRSTPSTATTSPNRLTTPSSRDRGVAGVGLAPPRAATAASLTDPPLQREPPPEPAHLDRGSATPQQRPIAG